jgi:hypothetical protein
LAKRAVPADWRESRNRERVAQKRVRRKPERGGFEANQGDFMTEIFRPESKKRQKFARRRSGSPEEREIAWGPFSLALSVSPFVP